MARTGKLTLANNPLLAGPALADRGRAVGPYREVPIDSIERDPNQPRVNFDEAKLKELSASISTYGIMNPLVVRQDKTPNKYRLIAGERRLRAARLAKLTSVPVMVSEDDVATSGDTVLAMQLVENLQRDDLTPLERAHAIGALKETYQLSIRQVADKLGVSKGMVQRSLEILELPDDLLNALREGAAESKILLLAKIEDESERAEYLHDLDTLTRSQLKSKMAKGGSEKPSKESKSVELDPDDQRIVEELRRALGLKVKMARSAQNEESGKLTIEFYSDDDLQELFRKLVSDH